MTSQDMVGAVREATRNLNVTVAALPYPIRGPRELHGAAYAVTDNQDDTVTLYRGNTVYHPSLPKAAAVQALTTLIKADGNWQYR